MILATFSAQNVLIGVLFVSLAVLILVIAYRKLLSYLGRGTPPKKDYCVLYSVEENPAKDEIVFYFTSNTVKDVRMELIYPDSSEVSIIYEGKCKVGGNIIRFDSTKVSDGDYHYQLVTDNQKTLKKIRILNG